MIDFEGYYFVDATKIESISVETNSAGENRYGLFLNLTGGKKYGAWYTTDIARKQARERLVRQIEAERNHDAQQILNRLFLIEQTVKGLDKRQFKIWKQLAALLKIEPETKN